MKKFIQFLKVRPLAIISIVFIFLLYLMMIFAEFIAPYTPAKTFEDATFHPANVEFHFIGAKSGGTFGLCARECRVINPVTWEYAKVKDAPSKGISGDEFHHKIRFFVHGDKYKLWGIFNSDLHLFGVVSSGAETTGTEEPGAAGSSNSATSVVQKTESYPVFLLGADGLGRDMFSRIVYGSRISLTIGFVASAISLFLAIMLGGLAGFYGGITDWSIMRFAEFFMLIPGLYLILFLRSLLNTKMDSGTSYMIITIILSLVGWPGSARTIRGIVHAVKREDFILNSTLEGVPSPRIIFFQIIPQISSLLIVSAALSVPGFIMSETTLSYLGLGIADPAVSWGSLINRDISTLSNLQHYPWLLTSVWLLLFVTLAFNFFGDALRDFFDPYHAVFHTFRKKNKEDSGQSSAESTCNESAAAEFQEKNSSIAHNSSASVNSPSVTDSSPLLEVRDLCVTFSILRGFNRVAVNAVKGISYCVNKGEILGLVGESGSGKSVSTSAIPSLLPENASVSGHVYFNDEKSGRVDLLSLSGEKLRSYRGKKIALIFQEPGRSFDPLQNISSVFLETFRNENPEISKTESDKKAAKLLEEVGIKEPFQRLVNFPHQFSGGQLQRIGIALALAQNCELLIADEPTTALDVTIQAQIVDLLLELKKKRNLSIIFISHNIELVAQISDRIAVMYKGKIVEQGSAKDVFNNPQHEYTKALLSCLPQFGTHYTDGDLKTFSGKFESKSAEESL